MAGGLVATAIRRRIQQGQVIRLRTSGKPFEVDRIDSDGIVLLFGAKRTPTRLRWEWLEGIVTFVREHGGSVPIGGTYDVEAEAGTLDCYLKPLIKRATANWVAALLEESVVVTTERANRHLNVRLASGSVQMPRVPEDSGSAPPWRTEQARADP